MANAWRRPRRITPAARPAGDLIVSLHESAVFRVVGPRALLDLGDRGIGRADLLAGSQGRACFLLPTEER